MESEDTLEQVRMVWNLHQFLILRFMSTRRMMMLQQIKDEEQALENKILILKSGLVTHANLDLSDSAII